LQDDASRSPYRHHLNVRRTLTWLLTLPFAAASVLLGHAIAYRALGMPADDLHGYLAHAPQLVLILATLALLGLAADSRARQHSPVPIASLAIGAFVAQEHLERLIHTGQVPFLLTSPVLWLGVALQLPLAFVVWTVARRLAEEIAAPRRRTVARTARFAVPPIALVGQPACSAPGAAHPGRGPPFSS
jgi:hypothetical protein